jgi:PAS domain S-box-containing protein
MMWQYTPYTIPLIVVGIGTVAFGLYIWWRRRTPEAAILAVLMLAVAEWSLAYAVGLASVGFPAKIFWAKVQYIGIVTIPASWLLFVLLYARREEWSRASRMGLLAIEPVLMLALVYTNDAHRLVWADSVMDTSGSFSLLAHTYGGGFWAHSIYSYVLFGIAILFIARAFIYSSQLYRKQAGVMLAASLAPLAGNLIYIFGLSPFPHLDLTPFAFTITCVVFAGGLSRFRLLDILPVARDAIIENMIDAVIVLDPQDHIMDINPSAERIIGHRASKSIGQPIAQMWSCWPDELGYCPDKAEISQEIALDDKEDRRIYGVRTSHQLDSQEQLVCRVIVLRDITERKQSAEALSQSEERYRTLVDSLQGGIYIYQDGKIVFLNKWLTEVFGYTLEDLRDSGLEKFMHPDDIESAMEVVAHRMGGGPALDPQFRFITKSGDVRWMQARAALMDYQGRPALLGNLVDITEQKLFEQQLFQTQRTEAITTLAGGIAHEFNNALVGVTGNMELLQMKFPDDKNVVKYVDRTKRAARRMTHLTEQLLAYAKGGKYQTQAISPNSFVENILSLIRHNIDSAIQLKTDLAMDACDIEADPTQMQMVLASILSNSAEAIEGPGRIRIVTRNVLINDESPEPVADLKPGSYVCFAIEDDGKGMDEKTRDRIFEPFFTTKFQGRGLGMAAAYGIVRNHEGAIIVDSAPDKGTRVSIYLPTTEARIEEAEETGVQMVAGAATILVIDDEEIVLDVARAMLEKLGHRVMAARTGKEAIDAARTFDGDIDLALLDIKLPDIEGGQLFPLIRKMRPDMKVVVCSGYSLDTLAQGILDAGAYAFIQKPFSLDTLSATLNEVLAG